MRLFWRILLSFWLAMLVIGLAAFAIQRSLLDAAPVATPELVRALGEIAVARAEQGDRARFDQWRRRVERATRSRIFLLGPDGREAGGRRVPDFIAEELAAVAPDTSENRWVPGGRLLVEPVGAGYRLVARIERSSGPFRGLPRGVRLLLLVSVTGLTCLFLALWLTRPVRRMRAAAMRLADGDLSVRVGSTVGRRRDEIASLARDLDRMAERLEALVRARDRLLRDISHELRSPLARLQLAIELARRGGTQVGAQLDRMEREAQRLDGLIGQVLRLARFEAGELEGAGGQVDLREVLRDVVTDAAFEAREMDREVILHDSPTSWISGDADVLRSAFDNILRNAVRYTAPGTRVDVTLRQHEGMAAVTIRDHGPGVPESERARIFDAFVRVGDARERDGGGHGLGLAIARQAIEAHGGTIDARNLDDGLMVMVRLPMERSAALE